MIRIRPFVVCALVLGSIVLGPACSKEQGADREKKQGEAQTETAGLVPFVKNNKLSNFPSRTIGDAFDSYRY